MKITANKRDDIVRRREEYDGEKRRRREQHDREWEEFSNAQESVFSVVRQEIEDILKPFTALQFDVYVNSRWGNLIEARVRCNEQRKFSEDSALSWDYSATLTKQGEIKKETGSWSGLKACTAAQMQSLRQTVEALEALNNIDWVTVLNKELPNYDDYITQYDQPLPDRPNFEQELIEADLEEAIGKDVLIKGKAFEGSPYRAGVDVYYMIIKETPKQYTIKCSWAGYVDDKATFEEKLRIVKGGYPIRVSKDKFISCLGKEVKLIKE